MMLHLDNALARVLGVALVVGGLGLPAAWADSDTVVADPNCVTKDAPKAQSYGQADTSALAAGCKANANGEGSVAIGHNAQTTRIERQDIESVGRFKVVDDQGNVEENFVVRTSGPNGKYYEWENASKFNVTANTDFTDPKVLAAIKTSQKNGVIVAHGSTEVKFFGRGVQDIEADVSYANDKSVTHSDGFDKERAVTNAVAIGNQAAVRGHGGIAIGSNSKVGVDDASTGHNLVAANRGIAIGNRAEVTGDNGIAIGSSVTAGKNEIRIGSSVHQDVYIAGINFVSGGSDNPSTAPPMFSIGDPGQTATIAGVNINQARADISANTFFISENSMAISENAFGILDNANQISTNASAISGFSERLLEVDDRVKQVAAMASALSAVPNVVPNDSNGNFYVGMGFGHYDGEQGMAIGVSGRLGTKRNILVNAGAAQSGGETSARVGFGLIW